MENVIEGNAGTKRKLPVIVPVAVIVLLVVVVSAIIGMYAFAPNYEKSIATISSATNDINGATRVNYMPILADDVDWAKLSDGDREGLARYAVGQAIEQAESKSTPAFTVVGRSAETDVFMYTGGEMITLYIDGQPVKIPLEA